MIKTCPSCGSPTRTARTQQGTHMVLDAYPLKHCGDWVIDRIPLGLGRSGFGVIKYMPLQHQGFDRYTSHRDTCPGTRRAA